MTATISGYDEINISDFATRLFAAVADSGDAMENLVKIGAEALGNPVIITDRSWNLIAISEGVGMPDDEDWTELMTNGYLSPESVTSGIRENIADRIESSDKPFIYKGAGMKYPRMLMRVCQGNKTVATVSVVEYFRPFREHDEAHLKLFSNAAAAELQKHGATRHTRGMLYEDFIGSLLDGRLHDTNVIKERAKLFGVGIHKFFYVFVFEVSEHDPNKFSIAYMRDMLERMISGGRALIYDNKIVIALSFTRARDVFNAELTTLGTFLKKHNMRCGISRRCTDLVDLRFFYEQANNAMRVGTRLAPARRIYPYGEYALFHIAETLCSSGGVKEYCHPALMKLIEYDSEYDTKFTNSLYMYFKCFRSVSKAAGKMNLHRNTLLYHIQRARDIMEIDLSDYNTSQLIELSLRLLEYESRLNFKSDHRDMIEWEN